MKHEWKQYKGKCDLIVGGSPCQSFSVAGHRLGMDDPRTGMRECELCDNDDFRPGVICKTPNQMKNDKQTASSQNCGPDVEDFIKKLTDSILEHLKN